MEEHAEILEQVDMSGQEMSSTTPVNNVIKIFAQHAFMSSKKQSLSRRPNTMKTQIYTKLLK